MHARHSAAAVALVIVSVLVTACVVHRYPPLGDVRTLGAGPIHGIVRVTRGAGLPTLDLSGVEIRDDTLFGWMRLRQSAGLVRTGVPLAEVRSISAKRVNWALTAVANVPLLALSGACVWCVVTQCAPGSSWGSSPSR